MVDKVRNIDEFEAAYSKGIGIEQDLEPTYADASKDNILIFADAVGDNNPLWIDEEYAKKSRFGMITAPPTFLFKVTLATLSLMPPLAGTPNPVRENISSMYSGTDFEFFRPIWVGDKFTVKAMPFSVVKRETKTRGAVVFGTGAASYFNQRHELVGTSRSSTAMVPIVRKSVEAPPVRVHDPDKPGVVRLNPDTLAFDRKSLRRGAKPRYWEDVEVGEEMTPPLEKGVLTATEITRFQLSVMSRPRLYTRPRGEEVVIGLARAATSQLSHGVVDPEDFGPQRISWLGQLVTEWMGDDGTLKKLSGQVRGPNMMGDINVLKGKVTKKYIEAGEHLVDCDLFCENQAGNVTAPGRATVALPSKG